MIKNLYANGCSWTAGDGVEKDPLLSNISTSERINIRRSYAWPNKLARLLGISCVNNALGGGSNDRMIRMTVDYVRSLSKEQQKETLVILGWTSSERAEVHVSYNGIEKWCRLNAWQRFQDQFGDNSPWPNYVLKDVEQYRLTRSKYLLSENACISKILRDMYLLSNFLENLSIPFLFFSSIGGISFPGSTLNLGQTFQKELNSISDPRFLDIISGKSMQSFCVDNSIPLSNCIHPMIEGHSRWADYLNSRLNEIYPSIFKEDHYD